MSQDVFLNCISQGFIKANLTRLCTSFHHAVKGKNTSWHTSCLCVIRHTSYLPTVKHTSCLCAKEKTSSLLPYMNKNRQLQAQLPLLQEVICPSASGACRSEIFLSHDSLKHSHFKLVNIMFTITSNDIPFSSEFTRNFCYKMILTFIKCPVCFYYT